MVTTSGPSGDDTWGACVTAAIVIHGALAEKQMPHFR